MMKFMAEEIVLELIRAVRPLLQKIAQQDRELEDQAHRAVMSAANNLSEGRRREGKGRFHSWRIAAGSAAETRMCLRIALAWGYLNDADAEEALALLDRAIAILYRLTHPRAQRAGV